MDERLPRNTPLVERFELLDLRGLQASGVSVEIRNFRALEQVALLRIGRSGRLWLTQAMEHQFG